MGVYGPRTVYVIALKDAPGCHEFLLQDDGKWLHVKETYEIGEYRQRSAAHFCTKACSKSWYSMISFNTLLQ